MRQPLPRMPPKFLETANARRRQALIEIVV
jgi:hypothetical protein